MPARYLPLILTLLYGVISVLPVNAADPLPFEVHEWSVWSGEPQARGMNSSQDFLTAMPGLVDTDRSRRRDPAKPPVSDLTPLSLMTLYGPPPEVVDIDLRISSGRPISQWPKSDAKSNRLRWLDLKVSPELTNKESLAIVPETSWFHQARELGGLYIEFKKDRTERFVTYDLELQASLPLRLDGGPEQYKIANQGKHKLLDMLLIVPTDKGVRVGWLDVANPFSGAAAGTNPPAQGSATPAQETITDIMLSEPLARDANEFRQQTREEMTKRLKAVGLTAGEIELLLELNGKAFFESGDIQIVYRMAREAVDEMTPLAIEPETAKITRVALVVARKVDPRLREDVQKLIVDLGNADYSQRESAEQKLKTLGRLAIPNLKDALKNSDLEVVMRAERLLLGMKEQLGAE